MYTYAQQRNEKTIVRLSTVIFSFHQKRCICTFRNPLEYESGLFKDYPSRIRNKRGSNEKKKKGRQPL